MNGHTKNAYRQICQQGEAILNDIIMCWGKLMMLFILATEYNECGWREAANDGVLTNLTAWEYRGGQKKQFSGAIYKTVGGG